MTVEELVNKSPNEVRNNEELMRLYVNYYKGAFSSTPDCAGCTFKNDFNKLKKHINNGGRLTPQIQTTMENKKFILKRRFKGDILTYRLDGKPVRRYGHLIDDEFAEAFIKNAKNKEEKKARQNMFELLSNEKENKADTEPKKEAAELGTKEEQKEPENEAKQAATESKEPKVVLEHLKRAELDKMLVERGLNPEEFPNKATVIKALKA